MPDDELIPTERVAKLMYFLMLGHRYTTMEASVLVGLQVRGTLDMLKKISRTVPLMGPAENTDRRWAMMTDVGEN
jgi:hypothetical protein